MPIHIGNNILCFALTPISVFVSLRSGINNNKTNKQHWIFAGSRQATGVGEETEHRWVSIARKPIKRYFSLPHLAGACELQRQHTCVCLFACARARHDAVEFQCKYFCKCNVHTTSNQQRYVPQMARNGRIWVKREPAVVAAALGEGKREKLRLHIWFLLCDYTVSTS